MSNYKPLLFGFASVCAAFSMEAQGTFQNLDFEAADIPALTIVNSLIPISEAFPGWSAYFGAGASVTEVNYDAISLGGPIISVIDANVPVFAPLQGTYSAFLFGGGEPGTLTSVSISQTGTVPAGTQSLQFDAYVFGSPFTVALGGQTINMSPLEMFPKSGSAPAYALYGGNVPASFAGLTETLTFTEPPATGVQPSELELDNIVFSPSSVTPEPSALALMGIGGLLFALYRRFAPRRQ
jgi:hypothetical protein